MEIATTLVETAVIFTIVALALIAVVDTLLPSFSRTLNDASGSPRQTQIRKSLMIFINGKYRLVRQTGVQRVGHELSSRVVDECRKRNVACEVLTPPTWIARSRFRPIFAAAWEQFILPLRARRGALVNLCNTAPVFVHGRQLVLLHDAAVFDVPMNYSKSYRAWTIFQLKRLAAGSSWLASVSNFSRARLAAALGRRENDFMLVREGAGHVFQIGESNEILSRLGVKSKSYILAVGSRQAGKNLKNLLAAVSRINTEHVLVIAGGTDSSIFSSAAEIDEKKCIRAGYVSEEELRSLYTHAICFVQASTYEGFGLPTIEAMALGTPVVCSNAASLPEVCGDAARYFDPNSPDDMAKVLEGVLKSEEVRADLVEKGKQRVQYYDWGLAAHELVENILTRI
jgi:glycosyltransferase involved in cell wall biosynthesis